MRTVFFVFAFTISISLASASEWVVQNDLSQDNNVHRIEARSGTVKRQDLYGIFEQRLVLGKKGKPFVIEEKRKVAMNCYTGRWDNLSVETYERVAGNKPTYQRKSTLQDIETSSFLGVDIRTAKASQDLSAMVWKFACSCESALKSKNLPTTPASEIQRFYETKVLTLPRSRDFLVGYIRVDDQKTAQKVIDLLTKGEDFHALATKYSSATEFPRGVIPWNNESAWSGKTLAILRSLQVNQHHLNPHEGVFGWEVYKLLDARTLPLSTLEQARSTIEAYLGNEKLCAPSSK